MAQAYRRQWIIVTSCWEASLTVDLEYNGSTPMGITENVEI